MARFQFSPASLRNRAGVDHRLIKISDRAIELTVIDFGIPSLGGLRTELQQNTLYNDGKSNCDGFNKRSKHQDGKALDFYAYVAGQASWNEYHLAMVAAAHLQAAAELKIPIKWGGLWKEFKDFPHIELIE